VGKNKMISPMYRTFMCNPVLVRTGERCCLKTCSLCSCKNRLFSFSAKAAPNHIGMQQTMHVLSFTNYPTVGLNGLTSLNRTHFTFLHFSIRSFDSDTTSTTSTCPW
jgi:hypothetical protein